VGLYGRNIGEFKGGGESGPLLAQFLKPPFSVKKAYRSLCASAINEDGTYKLSSAPLSEFLDPPLGRKLTFSAMTWSLSCTELHGHGRHQDF